jgi:hypothetical protein
MSMDEKESKRNAFVASSVQEEALFRRTRPCPPRTFVLASDRVIDEMSFLDRNLRCENRFFPTSMRTIKHASTAPPFLISAVDGSCLIPFE